MIVGCGNHGLVSNRKEVGTSLVENGEIEDYMFLREAEKRNGGDLSLVGNTVKPSRLGEGGSGRRTSDKKKGGRMLGGLGTQFQ